VITVYPQGRRIHRQEQSRVLASVRGRSSIDRDLREHAVCLRQQPAGTRLKRFPADLRMVASGLELDGGAV
jgi:hypothetical protein